MKIKDLQQLLELLKEVEDFAENISNSMPASSV